jgi:hypothetical protein
MGSFFSVKGEDRLESEGELRLVTLEYELAKDQANQRLRYVLKLGIFQLSVFES